MSESEKSVSIQGYLRQCAVILLVLVVTTGCMIATSFSHLGEGWTLKVTLILAIAAVNAFLVAGYLMHLLTEKKLVYTVLAFTVFFAIGLFGLTIWATNNFPTGTINR
jgi:caa(3)-type oxidase subunit IV